MIAKGKVVISHEKLKELFNLPDEVEFISIQDLSDGIEFNIASKEPIGLLTREVKNWENMRRQRVPRAILKTSSEEVKGYCRCGNPSKQRYRQSVTTDFGYLPEVFCADCHEPLYK